MPDLPVELWSMVVSHLSDTHQSHSITHQANLSAVARVNSNANTAASSKLYAHVQVIDFDGLFEGYDHTPSEKRQPKKHWLSTIKSMRGSFSYYDIAPRMGPVMTRLLVGHNHHDRLAEMMPNLSKVQLVSTFQGPLDYNRTPDYHCWSLLSLPAQHMCQTPYDRHAFSLDIRPSPVTMSMHQDSETQYHWEWKIADSIGNTGGEVITYIDDPAYIHLHDTSDMGDFWPEYEADLEERFGSSTYLVRNSTTPIEFKYKMYGLIDTDPCDDCHDDKQVTNVGYVDGHYANFGDHVFPLELEYHSMEDRPACPACGEE